MFDLIGYENQLENLIKNYNSKFLHSSIILYGPQGIGKRTFANNLISNIIKNIYGEKGFYHHINLFKNNTHPNIKILEKEIDKKTKKLKSYISIDQIRNIKQFINSTPSIKDFSKFLIVDSADDLNINSSNSLLKTLEEPNKDTYIFLISHQLSSLIPTIRSRCLKIKLNKHDYNNFKIIINNEIQQITEDECKFFYDLTNGSPGNALLLYDENIIEVFDLTLNCFDKNNVNNKNHELINILSKLNNDQFKIYLSILKSLLIILNKLKNNHFNSNSYLSNKFKYLINSSQNLSKKNIIDRFEFLSNNESDLFTYNMDKKIFMLKFLLN